MHLRQTLQAKNSYFCKLSYNYLFYNTFLTKNPHKTSTNTNLKTKSKPQNLPFAKNLKAKMRKKPSSKADFCLLSLIFGQGRCDLSFYKGK
ncbi:hypothetical protein B9T50_07510 [Zymomonas mobilis subsp. mobilis]|nr:hypothetical protein B9T50_07510 [Zymomonas mobilis subsp. mobilis]